MPHTKRSEAFRLRLAALQRKILAGTLDSIERLELVDILDKNTADSSCIVKAAEDEPIFVLRAHDATADKTVDQWCELQIERLVPIKDFTDRPNPFPKIADARDCAREMRDWPDRKDPD